MLSETKAFPQKALDGRGHCIPLALQVLNRFWENHGEKYPVLARLPTGARQEEELTGKLPPQTGIEAYALVLQVQENRGRRKLPRRRVNRQKEFPRGESFGSQNGS